MRTRNLYGTPLIPDSHTFLFNNGSRRTSFVPYLRMSEHRAEVRLHDGSALGKNVGWAYHLHRGEFANFFDGSWCALLELDAEYLFELSHCPTCLRCFVVIRRSNTTKAPPPASEDDGLNVLVCAGGWCTRGLQHLGERFGLSRLSSQASCLSLRMTLCAEACQRAGLFSLCVGMLEYTYCSVAESMFLSNYHPPQSWCGANLVECGLTMRNGSALLFGSQSWQGMTGGCTRRSLWPCIVQQNLTLLLIYQIKCMCA